MEETHVSWPGRGDLTYSLFLFLWLWLTQKLQQAELEVWALSKCRRGSTSLGAMSVLEWGRCTWWAAAEGRPHLAGPALLLGWCVEGGQENGAQSQAFLLSPALGSPWLWSPMGPNSHSGSKRSLATNLCHHSQGNQVLPNEQVWGTSRSQRTWLVRRLSGQFRILKQ